MKRSSRGIVIEVCREGVLEGARRLNGLPEGKDRVCVLNFASATNPGGGFRNGANQQEESLARSTALFACIRGARAEQFYAANKASNEQAGGTAGLYTHGLLYSPAVPFLRDETGHLRQDIFTAAIITTPAVNAKAVALRWGRGGKRKQNRHQTRAPPPPTEQPAGPKRMPSIVKKTMQKRIERVVQTAVGFGHTHLVLGAFGCGVFGNCPEMVANLFLEQLLKKHKRITHVSFSIPDEGPNFEVFSRQVRRYQDMERKQIQAKLHSKYAKLRDEYTAIMEKVAAYRKKEKKHAANPEKASRYAARIIEAEEVARRINQKGLDIRAKLEAALAAKAKGSDDGRAIARLRFV